MARVLAALLLLATLIACGHSGDDDGIQSSAVDGPGTFGLLPATDTVKGVIVYFHGRDQNPDVINENPHHRALFDPLLRAGYAVVAAEAGGNAFGNPTSLEDYRQLMVAARTKFRAEPVLFVAESMGALAALSLLREDTGHLIRGMVGITPLMGLPAEVRTVDFVANAWHGSVPDSADPMQWPTDTFAGRAFRLYQADQDKIIPYGARARDFARRFGRSADVSVIPCTGAHVAPSCYDPGGVEELVASLGG